MHDQNLWAMHLRDNSAMHPKFYQELTRQLKADFCHQLKFEVESTDLAIFYPLDHAPETYTIQRTGKIGWMFVHLVFMGLGSDARFAWYDPSEEHPPAIEHLPPAGIKCWWDWLNLKAYRARIEERALPPSRNPIADHLRFPMVWHAHPNEGVDYIIDLEGEPGYGEQFEQIMVDRQMKYNSPAMEHLVPGGIIHLVREAREVEPGRYRLSIDSGSASHYGLIFLLEGITWRIDRGEVWPMGREPDYPSDGIENNQ